MPNIQTKSRSLSQLYVFYERLKDDGYINLYGYVNSALDTQGANLNEILSTASTIRSIAQREATKEQNLLNKIFNANIIIDLNDNRSLKNFIDTFNSYLGLKEVYERNIFLIKNSQGSKSVISFFPTYFLMVWNERWPTIISIIENQINSASKRQDILDIIVEVVNQQSSNIVETAIERMFQAHPELEGMSEKMEDAYLSLLSAIGKVEKQGSLAHQIYNIYKIDELSNAIVESLSNKNKKRIRQELNKIDVKEIIGKDSAQRGGLTLEAIENTVYQMIAESINSVSGAHMAAFSSGSTGIKADNIVSFNIDPTLIEETLENNEKVSRERNIRMFEQLGEKLKNIEDGYIVYSSAKNYTYNKNFFSRGGFSGEKINLDTYHNILGNINKNMDTFVGTILQTTKGAVGERLRPKLEDAIAQDIAYLLFDDFKTIGKEVGAGDPQAIHIMDLNGILIPLSFFLTLFARAIEDGISSPRNFVRATIKNTTIEFPTKEDQSNWQKENSQNAWDYQREQGLNNTWIEVHFLRDFQNIISNYL